MDKTLIIKRVSNDFDEYVTKQLMRELSNVVVKDAFKFNGRIGRRVIKVLKRLDSDTLFGYVLTLNKKELAKFKTIILFDDYPDLNLLKYLKKNSPNCNIKLWFWNVPNYNIELYKKYCDMYCFDHKFCNKYCIKHINQFYFPSAVYARHNSVSNDVVFIGIDKNRNELLSEIADMLDCFNIKYQLRLIDAKSCKDNRIIYEKEPLKYSTVIEACLESKAILELVADNQQGLTWRSLEALFFEKKLITNNKSIVDYDFYDKRNIFIYGVDSVSSLRAFIASPFVTVDEEVINKYTVQYWYKQIMED